MAAWHQQTPQRLHIVLSASWALADRKRRATAAGALGKLGVNRQTQRHGAALTRNNIISGGGKRLTNALASTYAKWRGNSITLRSASAYRLFRACVFICAAALCMWLAATALLSS